jgi:hypothetical protein
MTAYSATSCPRSSDHRSCKNLFTGLLLPVKYSSREREEMLTRWISTEISLTSLVF